jgi:hypothetical protein
MFAKSKISSSSFIKAIIPAKSAIFLSGGEL